MMETDTKIKIGFVIVLLVIMFFLALLFKSLSEQKNLSFETCSEMGYDYTPGLSTSKFFNDDVFIRCERVINDTLETKYFKKIEKEVN